VRASELLHKNPVSAYDGRELRGLVRRTWLAGHPVSVSADAASVGTLLSRP
jgi:allantoinase